MFTELDKFNNLQIYQSQSKKNHWGFISPENEYITTRSVKKGQIFNHFGNAIALQLELLEHLEKHKCDKIRIWIPDFEKEGFWAEMPVRDFRSTAIKYFGERAIFNYDKKDYSRYGQQIRVPMNSFPRVYNKQNKLVKL